MLLSFRLGCLAPYEAKFRYDGEQIWRRIGPAWMELNADTHTGGASAERFRARRGRVAEGYFDERAAHVRAAELVAAYVREQNALSTEAKERAAAGATFREVAHAYLDWLERIKGANPPRFASTAATWASQVSVTAAAREPPTVTSWLRSTLSRPHESVRTRSMRCSRP